MQAAVNAKKYMKWIAIPLIQYLRKSLAQRKVFAAEYDERLQLLCAFFSWVTSFEALRTVKNDDQALQTQQSSCIQLYAAPTVLLHTQEQRTTEEFAAYFLKK